MSELRDGEIRHYEIRPEQFGLSPAPLAAVQGGEVERNVELARQILGGAPGPASDLVALNAGAALYVAGAAEDIQEGVERARSHLSEGGPMERLERLRRASHAAAVGP